VRYAHPGQISKTPRVLTMKNLNKRDLTIIKNLVINRLGYLSTKDDPNSDAAQEFSELFKKLQELVVVAPDGRAPSDIKRK